MHCERNQLYASPNSMIVAPNIRSMVTVNPYLMRGFEVERRTIKFPSPHGVSTGHIFDSTLRELGPLFGFRAGDESCTYKSRDLGFRFLPVLVERVQSTG